MSQAKEKDLSSRLNVVTMENLEKYLGVPILHGRVTERPVSTFWTRSKVSSSAGMQENFHLLVESL